MNSAPNGMHHGTYFLFGAILNENTPRNIGMETCLARTHKKSFSYLFSNDWIIKDTILILPWFDWSLMKEKSQSLTCVAWDKSVMKSTYGCLLVTPSTPTFDIKRIKKIIPEGIFQQRRRACGSCELISKIR